MIKHLFISATILSIFSGNMVFASGANNSTEKSPKEEQEYVIKETKKVKDEIKTLKKTQDSLLEIAENKKESISKLGEQLSKEEKELSKLKQQIKEEKERIAEEQRLAKIQKEKEEAERIAKEKAEKEAKEKAEKEEAKRIADEKAKAEQEAEEAKKETTNISTKNSETNTENTSYVPSGAKLTASAGVFQGPSGKETYYNLDMSGVISIAKSQGIKGNYWVRDDGVKMYGDYVIVAAHLGIRPRGSLIQTSLGMGIVLDTGGFASSNSTQLDIATNW